MSKVCIIVGHGKSKTGGYDSGAVNGEYHEFKIAKEIALHAQQSLNNDYGIECDLMNYDGSLYLQDRINKLQDDYYSYIAEVHLNAGGGTGTEVYYSNGDSTGKKYAESIAKSISDTFGIANRGAKIRLNSKGKDYFGIIRATKPTANLIETVFIDRLNDLEKVKTADGQCKCGKAIAEAIAAVMGASKKETQVKAPAEPKAESINVTYQTYSDGKWLPWVRDYNDVNSDGYAGIKGKAVTAIRAGVSQSNIKYRAHTKNGKWYSWVTDFNTVNSDGYAGVLGKDIDMIQISLVNVPRYAVEYRVAPVGKDYLPWVRDYNEVNSNGYAGIKGKAFDRLQIRIVKI